VSAPAHIPVLRDASVRLLAAGPGRRIVDGTFGQGGHSRALLAAGAEVLGLDLDPDAGVVGRALAAAESRFHFQHRSFRDLAGALAAAGWAEADGLLLDLGVSSLQIDEPAKGFTYRADAPLDLRFDPAAGPSAAWRRCCGPTARSAARGASPPPWSPRAANAPWPPPARCARSWPRPWAAAPS